MPQITAVKPQKKRENRFNIYIDGEFSFALPAEALAKANLFVGQELLEKEIDRLIIENEVGKLYEKALHFLSYRPRSEKEVQDFLIKKQASPKVLEKVLEKLKKGRFLNDWEFAKWWVEQRRGFSPRGRWLVKMELIKKGVDREVIDSVFGKEEELDEKELAQKALAKKLKAWQKLPHDVFFKKAASFLQRRGFSWETVKLVIVKGLTKF